ncbi:nucleoside-diphosphate kinase [Candidatus Woesearchaeota archaeon]|jgi:nucleoside-diphosphate kinase|nr:nucleoside-diphosphate kinase [Candidatus Woesearchaeota archaeon]MBT3537818.1 nucleoside-diphosphate kinase [Candidatus Woesearchaeota archaeon]MBT4697949.1 nucleoside-diphosphate kinase [Candidatus Woesearchaeota archaeon]MBT7105487.1 nucleoside-diphosphate kinase [Candidatus Woesearchaeota archaeon]MBT7931677.1 nucleoside-diphosphate kinase [Candidatus Woesearchaeota archaeon]
MREKSLVLIKPDGVQRGLIGRIMQRFEDVGLKMVGMKMVWVDKEFAKEHYAAHVDKPFYPGLECMITEGPVVAMVLEGLHAVEQVRKMVGKTEPKSAEPGTIRGDFSQHSYAYTDAKGIAIKNLIHASGNVEEANAEVALWFKEGEMHDYKTVHEKHVF